MAAQAGVYNTLDWGARTDREGYINEILSGQISSTFPGWAVSASAPAIADNGTIATASVNIARVTPAAAKTGIIMAAGSIDGQVCAVQNKGTSTASLTFATDATSNVLGGTAIAVPAASMGVFVWDSGLARWVPQFGVLTTATAAELNVNAGVTAGTASASKTAVLGATKNLDTLTLDQHLNLKSAASVAFSATMALVVATPKIEIAANHTTSATATVNCAAVAPDGDVLVILIKEGAGTGTVVTTFGTHFKSTGTLTTASSGTSSISFLGDGTNWNETGRGATLA